MSHDASVVVHLVVVAKRRVPGTVDELLIELGEVAQTASEHLGLGGGEVPELRVVATRRSGGLLLGCS